MSLGESLHLTSEFPLVRAGIIRYLNAELGFHVVAFEGSPEDVWISQDRLLASPRADSDITTALGGLFPIWNTHDVREVIAHEVATWKTNHPLYVTAYDVQPGTGMTTHGPDVFRQLGERLAIYAPPPNGITAEAIANDLAPLVGACANYSRDDSAKVESAIANLDTWTKSAAPIVETKYTNVPHAAVLRLIPENVRASHRLCLARAGSNWNRYKSVRDTNAAHFALALKDAAPDKKLILWAHLSHVAYHAENGGSAGGVLHETLGSRMYTIVPFAQSGIAPLIYSDVNDDIAYGRVRMGDGPAAAKLARLADTGDVFVDLRGATDSAFTKTQGMIVEGEAWPVTPARDFDGMLWIRRVHGARFMSAAMPLMLGGFTAMHYRWDLGAVLFVAIALLVVRRLRTRAKERDPSLRSG